MCLPVCVSVYGVCACCPQRLEELIRSPGIGVSHSFSCHVDAGDQTWVGPMEVLFAIKSHLQVQCFLTSKATYVRNLTPSEAVSRNEPFGKCLHPQYLALMKE